MNEIFKQTWTALPLKMGQIGLPETSVNNYQLHRITSQKSEDINYTSVET
jgi:hypothetical protein